MKGKYHDPENYTISVRKEVHDSIEYWVARVAELPDVLEFGDSHEDAYSSAIYTIKVSQEMCHEDGITFPEPMSFDAVEGSGRVTLRLRASTKNQAIKIAATEGVSLNAYLSACIERDIGKNAMSASLSITLSDIIENNISKLLSSNQRLINGLSHAFKSVHRLQVNQNQKLVLELNEDEEPLDYGFEFTQHRKSLSLGRA